MTVPMNYNGEPAKPSEELTPGEVSQADQDNAAADDALRFLVTELASVVVVLGGEHPGRQSVSAGFLNAVNEYPEGNLKMILQMACWRLAEALLERLDDEGELAAQYGIRYERRAGYDPF